MRIFTFIGMRNDGSRPVLEMGHFESQTTALVAARRILQDHPTCDRIEGWDEDGWRFTVGAPALG